MAATAKLWRSKRDLSTPRYGDRFGYHYDPEGFGRFSERIAHTMGTGRFLVIQTVVVAAWIVYNATVPEAWQLDPPWRMVTLRGEGLNPDPGAPVRDEFTLVVGPDGGVGPFEPSRRQHLIHARQAVTLANDTPFGLGSYLFTTDPEQAARVADAIQAGMVYVNIVGADSPELPFGGVKRSGSGRELGRWGADEFVNKKLIRIGA